MEPNNSNLSLPKDQADNSNLPKAERFKAKPGFWWETTKFALIILFIVIPLRLYIVQPFIVSGQSMEHTFESGQYLLVDELSYRWSNPERGDVIIFHYPLDTKKYFIKRIIGLPGDTVEINGDEITIKNEENLSGTILKDDFLANELLTKNPGFKKTYTLTDTQYFVLGDNRLQSSDSRVWGTLDRKYIVGRPIVRLLEITSSFADSWFPIKFISPKDMGLYPGQHREIDEK
ncbi:MAG: signal peptidase I [Minisyncoccia bacterium]